MINESQVKPYVRIMDQQASLYEYFARQYGLQNKSLQLLLWVANYPQSHGSYVTQKFLAERTYSSKQVVNATIKNWRDKGYVELLENPADKRHKLIRLTETGQVYADKIIQPLNQIEQAAIGVLSSEEQETLLGLTSKYNQALKEEMEKL
ncbi:DNA-binding transcriptional regulator, MarR family [Streptococcus henryi]|uniref:DNA-binding transcriptional regulator, MarR family n=1 Tax=Streptococcus henryi TaxID=439219 RepID=A0A1G6CNP5_9STRE|nr:MarR family winged helix-turn-helix transcriptional regulator [Streptococcus henryi]SDB34496.1 DNA-binding transcriptional regulator, MarR family [Streptococcus henryi]